eukprot:7871968-Pyramimonas_sp.AAC.1
MACIPIRLATISQSSGMDHPRLLTPLEDCLPRIHASPSHRSLHLHGAPIKRACGQRTAPYANIRPAHAPLPSPPLRSAKLATTTCRGHIISSSSYGHKRPRETFVHAQLGRAEAPSSRPASQLAPSAHSLSK